jgi:hypothetical protein
MTASLLRKRSRSRPFLIDSPVLSVEELSVRTLLQVNHDRPGVEMLCRIAHNPAENFAWPVDARRTSLLTLDGNEQFRPAIVWGVSDHGRRDEHFFSLYSGL